MKTVKTLLSVLVASSVLGTVPAMAEDSYKVSDEPLKLDIHLHTKKYVYDNNWPVEKEASRLTNVHLNNVASMATTSSDEAFNLLIASGDLPDIVGGSALKDKVNQYGPEGAFQPLNELIEKHAPNIKKVFEENPDIWASIKAYDGNVYYIPYLPDGKYGRGYFIRYDWLDALGLEVPETVDEYYEVLKAFRDQDPNGNGKKDEVPFFARHWEEVSRLVTLWGGRQSGNDTFHDFYVDNGKISHGYTEDEYRVGIRNIAKWYDEGLIDAEVFTRGSRSREYMLANNIGGATHDWFASTSGYNDSMAEKVPSISFKAMLPPEGATGLRFEEHRRASVKTAGWAISYTNENPVETIKYFDFFFGEKGRNLANFGVEGVHHDLIDGKPVYKPEVLNSDNAVNNQMRAIGSQIERGFLQDFEYEKAWSNSYALEGIALYDTQDILIDSFLGASMNKSEQAIYDKYWVTIRDYMLEMQQAWILGSRDVDADWDAYQAQIKRMGYHKVVEAYQSAYDRAYK